MQRVCLALLATLMLAVPAPSLAKGDGGRPDGWYLGEATVRLTGDMTVNEARAKAHEAAQVAAIKRAQGQFLSQTRTDYEFITAGNVEGFMETHRASEILGIIKEEKDVIHTPIQNESITCRGYFKVDPPPPTSRSLWVKLNLDRQRYQTGDRLKFQVESNEEASLMVFNISSNQRVYPVYPNQFVPSLAIQPRQPRWFPDEKDPFDIKPEPLPGQRANDEYLMVIAMTKAYPPPKTGKDGTLSKVELMNWIGRLPGGKYQSAVKKFRVVASEDTD